MILSNGYRFLADAQNVRVQSQQASGYIATDGSTNAVYVYRVYTTSDYLHGWQHTRTTWETDRTALLDCGSFATLSNGTIVYCANNNTFTPYATGGVILGDGNTAPTVNDYRLSGNMLTTFSASISISRTTLADQFYGTATYTITNTGADTLNIREIAASIPSVATDKRILLTRDVLPSPVIIEPGETGILAYKIKIS